MVTNPRSSILPGKITCFYYVYTVCPALLPLVILCLALSIVANLTIFGVSAVVAIVHSFYFSLYMSSSHPFSPFLCRYSNHSTGIYGCVIIVMSQSLTSMEMTFYCWVFSLSLSHIHTRVREHTHTQSPPTARAYTIHRKR